MDVAGLGSQAEADRKKAKREEERAKYANEADRAIAAKNQERTEKLLEKLIREMVKSNAAAFQNKELLDRVLEELRGSDKEKAGNRVKVPWQTRMCEQEKADREALWIPLTDVVVTKAMVESQFKMLVKHVHPDLNKDLGDGPFIALKAARDRMLKRVVT